MQAVFGRHANGGYVQLRQDGYEQYFVVKAQWDRVFLIRALQESALLLYRKSFAQKILTDAPTARLQVVPQLAADL